MRAGVASAQRWEAAGQGSGADSAATPRTEPSVPASHSGDLGNYFTTCASAPSVVPLGLYRAAVGGKGWRSARHTGSPP